MAYIYKFRRLTPSISAHFKAQIVKKGFAPQDVIDAFKHPERVYPSKSHPGQWRICGFGICIVGEPNEKTGVFRFITLYADGTLTPPRPDQLDTPEGRRYAERYEQGKGRG